MAKQFFALLLVCVSAGAAICETIPSQVGVQHDVTENVTRLKENLRDLYKNTREGVGKVYGEARPILEYKIQEGYNNIKSNPKFAKTIEDMKPRIEKVRERAIPLFEQGKGKFLNIWNKANNHVNAPISQPLPQIIPVEPVKPVLEQVQTLEQSPEFKPEEKEMSN